MVKNFVLWEWVKQKKMSVHLHVIITKLKYSRTVQGKIKQSHTWNT